MIFLSLSFPCLDLIALSKCARREPHFMLYYEKEEKVEDDEKVDEDDDDDADGCGDDDDEDDGGGVYVQLHGLFHAVSPPLVWLICTSGQIFMC